MPGETAAVLAHEMGHNLGFRHDDQIAGGCACDDPEGLCIMNSYAMLVPSVISLFLTSLSLFDAVVLT